MKHKLNTVYLARQHGLGLRTADGQHMHAVG